MKIAYITSIDTSKHAASSNQVKSMLRAFDNSENADITICNSNVYRKKLLKLKLDKGRYLKFLTPFLFIRIVFKKEIKNIYCRESFIALIFLLLRRNVFFEIHEINNTKLESLLLNVITLFKRLTFITVSQAAKIDIEKKYKSKVVTLPNGVFIEDYNDLIKVKSDIKGELYNKYPKKRNVVYTGSLYKGRDAHLVFVAASKYSDANFILIGGTTEQYDKIKSEFANVNNVYHIPAVPQSVVKQYQVTADILIYPISIENKIAMHTSPLKLFEYMASRTPIIANSVGSVSEIINKENCFIIEDFERSGEMIEFILNCNEWQISEKTDAASKYIEKFTWSARVEKIIVLFKKNEVN